MARVPERGNVKTRLSAAIGPDRALAIYVRLLERTRKVVHEAAARTHAAVFWGGTGPAAADWFARFDTAAEAFAQDGGDLGARMRHACERLLASHRPVIIVGADSPDLTADDLTEALACAAQDQIVFVPAADGGYVAVAMQTLAEPVFFDHGWGSASVLKNSLSALHQDGFQTLCRPVRHDLDEVQDLDRFPWLESPPFRA
jgi:rSAM/selenodomain-associated transferase 1